MGDWLQRKDFIRASGQPANFKLEEEECSDEVIETAAFKIAQALPPFRVVFGVPRGGLRLQNTLDKYISAKGPILICDDVFTTGGSMEKFIAQLPLNKNVEIIGAVIWAINEPPDWIFPLFQMHHCWNGRPRLVK